MGERVHQLPVPCFTLGEGPYWVEDEQALLVWLTMAIPVEGEKDLWVVGLGNTLATVHWAASDPDHHTVKPKVLHATDDFHFNDAKCDPEGRLWTGTMSKLDDDWEPISPRSCFLYKYDHNLDITTCAKDVTLSNGMTWSNDKKHFYYVDSFTACVYHFDYDAAKGKLSRVLLDFKAAGLNGVPDGMTIDKDDNLWIACFLGGKVVCVDPRRRAVVREVTVPALSVTSVCWGGEDYATLYVTTGTFRMTPEQCAAQPSAGGTFAITGLGTRGSPPVPFKPDLTKLRAKLQL
ncbi:Regucalcin [Chionoecetes opilio]|uniref:Regucalcin n=1 Tax=Chionoecetes opilio TaxID=41210 RepID=A0A8J4YBB1_CHIOP|nr:Regucalcin [Chionoecetes opilio]